jgi:hypothetical protein
MDEQFVVIVGNLVDGFRFVGPFADFDDASVYSDRFESGSADWIAVLEAPEVTKKGQDNE